jgi:hypothetical protein
VIKKLLGLKSNGKTIIWYYCGVGDLGLIDSYEIKRGWGMGRTKEDWINRGGKDISVAEWQGEDFPLIGWQG